MTSAGQLGQSTSTRSAGGIVTPAMIDLMCATRGWALTATVMSWFTAGLMAITAVVMIVMSLTVDGGGVIRLVAWPYLAMALLTMVPAVLLTRYVSALGRLRDQRSERPLAEALNHERRLWKFSAIMMLVVLAIAIGGVLAAIAIPTLFK